MVEMAAKMFFFWLSILECFQKGRGLPSSASVLLHLFIDTFSDSSVDSVGSRVKKTSMIMIGILERETPVVGLLLKIHSSRERKVEKVDKIWVAGVSFTMHSHSFK